MSCTYKACTVYARERSSGSPKASFEAKRCGRVQDDVEALAAGAAVRQGLQGCGGVQRRTFRGVLAQLGECPRGMCARSTHCLFFSIISCRV
jgi:hypothetical protein